MRMRDAVLVGTRVIADRAGRATSEATVRLLAIAGWALDGRQRPAATAAAGRDRHARHRDQRRDARGEDPRPARAVPENRKQTRQLRLAHAGHEPGESREPQR